MNAWNEPVQVASGWDLDEAIRVCRERGWSVIYVPGEGFRPCPHDEPGAYVDLDRYHHWLYDALTHRYG
jgi:hypothetical protein